MPPKKSAAAKRATASARRSTKISAPAVTKTATPQAPRPAVKASNGCQIKKKAQIESDSSDTEDSQSESLESNSNDQNCAPKPVPRPRHFRAMAV